MPKHEPKSEKSRFEDFSKCLACDEYRHQDAEWPKVFLSEQNGDRLALQKFVWRSARIEGQIGQQIDNRAEAAADDDGARQIANWIDEFLQSSTFLGSKKLGVF